MDLNHARLPIPPQRLVWCCITVPEEYDFRKGAESSLLPQRIHGRVVALFEKLYLARGSRILGGRNLFA